MKFSYLQCAVLTLALAACASNRPDATGSDQLATANTESVPTEVVSTPVQPGTGGDALICDQIKVIGTLIPKRVCKTRAQIEAERIAAKSTTDDLQTLGPYRDPAMPRDTGKAQPIR